MTDKKICLECANIENGRVCIYNHNDAYRIEVDGSIALIYKSNETVICSECGKPTKYYYEKLLINPIEEGLNEIRIFQ